MAEASRQRVPLPLQLGQTLRPSHVGHLSFVNPIAPDCEPTPLHRGHLPLPLQVEHVPAIVLPPSMVFVIHKVGLMSRTRASDVSRGSVLASWPGRVPLPSRRGAAVRP